MPRDRRRERLMLPRSAIAAVVILGMLGLWLPVRAAERTDTSPPPANALATCLEGLTDGWRQCGTPIPLVDKMSVPPILRAAGSPDAVIKDWQGAAHVMDELGPAMVFHGSGGHAQYGGNETYKLDLLSLTWSLVTDIPQVSASATAADVCKPVYPDGSPNSVHSYDGLTYDPDNNTVYRFGGAVYCPWSPNGPSRNTIPRNYIWALSLDGTFPKPANAWRIVATELDFPSDVNAITEMSLPTSAFDPASRHIFFAGRKYIYDFDPTTETFAPVISNGEGTGNMLVVDSPDAAGTVRHLLFNSVNTRVAVYDIAGPIFKITTCVKPTVVRGSIKGAVWHPGLDRMVLLNGDDTVWLFDWRTCGWEQRNWTSGPPGTAKGADRVFSKAMYVPQVDAVALYSDAAEAPWFLRLDPNVSGNPVLAALRRRGFECADQFIEAACPRLSDLLRDGGSVKLPVRGIYRQCAVIMKPTVLDLNGSVVERVVCGGKAAFVTNADFTLSNGTCRGFRVDDGNGSCIRQQAGALTVEDMSFTDSQGGILTGRDVGPLVVRRSRFSGLGGDCRVKCGRAHAIYYKGDDLRIADSRFEKPRDEAHLVKTGAARTVIVRSVLDEREGEGSRLVDAYNGGILEIIDSTLVNAPGGQRQVIGFDFEARRDHAGNRITIRGGSVDCAGGPLIGGRNSLAEATVEVESDLRNCP